MTPSEKQAEIRHRLISQFDLSGSDPDFLDAALGELVEAVKGEIPIIVNELEKFPIRDVYNAMEKIFGSGLGIQGRMLEMMYPKKAKRVLDYLRNQ